MVLLKFFNVKNLIQIYTKTHQIAPFFKKNSRGTYPRTPLAKRMASRHANFQISKKKFLAPPLPKPGDAPDLLFLYKNDYF